MSIPATAPGCLACRSSSHSGSHGYWAARRAVAFTCAARPLILSIFSLRHPLQLAGPKALLEAVVCFERGRDSSEIQQAAQVPGLSKLCWDCSPQAEPSRQLREMCACHVAASDCQNG